MKLLVLLIALGLRQTEPGRELSTAVVRLLRRWRDGWLERGTREGWQSGVVLGLIVLPPVLIVLALVLAVQGTYFGLWHSAISLAVMMLVLLDRELPEVIRREREGWLAADEQGREVLAHAEPQALEAAAAGELARARAALLAEQLRELFAPVFWFVLLGPVAALAYYFLRLVAAAPASPVAALAGRLLHWADWPVVRVLGLSFALAGDFVATWQYWRTHALDRDIAAVAMLEESAQAAQPANFRLDAETLPGPQLTSALEAAAALLHRALIIWIVLLALHTLWP